MNVRHLPGLFFLLQMLPNTEAYSYASQTFMTKLLGKLVNGSQQLTTFVKSSILDVRVGSQCVFAVVSEEHQYQYGMEDIQ